MATENRPSLITTLEKRYQNQQAGGAFDAKNITVSGHSSLSKDGTPSVQSSMWTPKGFKTKVTKLVTEFNDKALKFADYLGVDTRKYKG